MHLAEPASLRPEDQRRLLHLLVQDHASPFTAISRTKGRPQSVILINRGYTEEDKSESVECVCRIGDCTGRWPIARFDADNLPNRPYVCTVVGLYYVPERGDVPVFRTEAKPGGLAEPPLR